MAAGKENPQPEGLDPKHLNHLKKLDAKANYHLEYNDLKEKLPKLFKEYQSRGIGRVLSVELYNDDDEVVATENVGYILPAETDNRGKVTKGVSTLKNGLILEMEPNLQHEKVKQKFHKEFSPNDLPLVIEMHIDNKETMMSEVAEVMRRDSKILVDSDCEPQVSDALDVLDKATVFAWNLKKSKERGLHKSAKGAVTIFERFLKAFDTESLDNIKDPPKDLPPTQEQPPAK